MKHYTIVRTDNFSETTYDSTSRNALKHAKEIGRANDTIHVYDGDKLVSGAKWSSEDRRYIRISV